MIWGKNQKLEIRSSQESGPELLYLSDKIEANSENILIRIQTKHYLLHTPTLQQPTLHYKSF